MTKFSPKYSTYQEWKQANPGKSEYTERIRREHARYPKASLSQLRGHPSKKRKPLSKLKPKKERKKPKKMQIVVSGNIVTDDRSHTAKNVYVEFYIKSTKDKEKIAEDIFDFLKKKGLKIFPTQDEESTVIVNFRDKLFGNKGKVISQKKAKQSIYDYISLQLHVAGPHNKPGVPHNKPGVSHHGDRTKEYEKRKEQRRMKKERYDNNGY
jgi:hypothetical protein